MVVHTVPKTVSTLTSDFISKQSPMSTPAGLIANLPGVVASSQGPLTTSFESFHIRGLDRTEIGVIYEGIPAANPFTYSVYTTSMVDPENMGAISVMQGSSDMNAPVYNAVGAQISMSLRRPATHPVLFGQASGGTRSVNKEFVRFDTGEIGHSKVYGFVSGSYSSGNLWRGPGSVSRWHMDAALTRQWGHKSESELVFGYTKADQTSWLYPTQAQWQQYGIGYTANTDPTSPGYYQIYKSNTGTVFGALKNHFAFAHGLSLDATAYSVRFNGPYSWGTPVPVSNGYLGTQRYDHLDGYPPSSRRIQAVVNNPWFTISSGLSLVGRWQKSFNTLSVSYWYSYANQAVERYYYPLSAQGQWTRSSGYLTVFGGRRLTEDAQNAMQQLNAIALNDRISLLGGKLTVDAGLKTAMVSRQYTMDLPGADPYKSVRNVFVPVPQILLSYRFADAHQIYVNGTTGYRMPNTLSSQVSTYSVFTGRPQSRPLDPYEPEYMIGEEIGYRYSGALIANLAYFHYNMTHHQITSTSYVPGTTNLISQAIDAGGQSADGVQLELGTRPWHGLSLHASGQFMKSRIGNNIAYQGDYLPTKGKQEPGAPRFLANFGLSYDDGANFGTFNFRYSDAQYATLMNDQGIPAYMTADLSLGRRLPKIGRVAPSLQLNLINVTDQHYLSSVYGYTAAARPQRGVFGSRLAGSQPTYEIGSGFAAIVGLSATYE
ncbi:TonB-dependent receptor [Swaminathania salitolerans LMG 21291]|uniref:TonB-dependent receptor n=2 Tax=Swaminathania salitolerans TaxID=182838 RepID=A0A511BQQ6_9PROT|nr:TonB-dependent receptor [Swaminathania salitolerans LMG 21291]GEL02669.1 TonB-dependent receptor [Swaminathania salitolerans]